MDVWLNVLAFVLALAFFFAVLICVRAVRRAGEILIRSRLHRGLHLSEVIYANAGLLLVLLLVILKLYSFVPAALLFVLFVVLSTRIESGLTAEGVLVGTTFAEWDFVKGFKFTDDETDSNIVILKIRANRKQYVLVCNREDREKIRELFQKNHVRETEVMKL